MEIENESKKEVMSKKLWKLVKVGMVLVKKGFAKSKLVVDVALLLKRSNKLAGKSLHSLLSPSSSNAVVKDYEFDCSSSPAFPFLHFPKRGKSLLHLHSRAHSTGPHLDEAATMDAVQRVLEMINANGEAVDESPAVPPLGWSRQLRVTDSPFPVKESEEETVRVNKAADDFINKFYSNLRLQKSTAVDSPYHDTWAS